MKFNKKDTGVLVASVACIAGFGLYGLWSSHRVALAKSRLGRYQRTYQMRGEFASQGKPVKVVSVLELMPDGQCTRQEHFQEVYVKRPGKGLRLGFKINPDGTLTFVQKGTYKMVGNEVDLIEHHQRSTPPFSVTTARFTEKGFTAIRYSSAHKIEEIRSGEVPEGKEPNVTEVAEDGQLHYTRIK